MMIPGIVAQRRLGVSPVNTFAEEVAADSPLLWFRMAITSGTSIPNAGSGSGSLVLSGSPYSLGQPSIVGGAGDFSVGFDGNSASVTSDAYALPTANVTLMAVFATSPGITSGTIATPHSSNNPDELTGSRDRAMYVNSSGKLVCPIWTGAITTLSTPDVVNDGTAHIAHLVCGANAGEGSVLYIDGVAVDSVAAISVDTSGVRFLQVGRSNYSAWPGGALATLVGRIDEVAWFNSALSATRVQAHAQSAGLYTPP